MSKTELTDFPPEVLLRIFSYLDVDELHQEVALVCKLFLELSRTPELTPSLTLTGKAFPDYQLQRYNAVRKKFETFCQTFWFVEKFTVSNEDLQYQYWEDHHPEETFFDQLCQLPGKELCLKAFDFGMFGNSSAKNAKAYVEKRTDKTVTVIENGENDYPDGFW